MPQTALNGWWTAPGLTMWKVTRWRCQRTSDKVPHYSIYRPRKDERLSWPSWLTCSGRFTHINGHPSAASRAYDRETTPAKDRRSTNCATQPTWSVCHGHYGRNTPPIWTELTLFEIITRNWKLYYFYRLHQRHYCHRLSPLLSSTPDSIHTFSTNHFHHSLSIIDLPWTDFTA